MLVILCLVNESAKICLMEFTFFVGARENNRQINIQKRHVIPDSNKFYEDYKDKHDSELEGGVDIFIN